MFHPTSHPHPQERATTLTSLVHRCAPQIHPDTLSKIVLTESSANPYAIGVVAGRIERQPRNRAEAIATARALAQQGVNFSAGLGQINVSNWARLGLDVSSVFDPCRNLSAAQAVLRDCFERAPERRRALRSQAPEQGRGQGQQQHHGHGQGQGTAPAVPAARDQRALRQALSCYYSGNFSTGFGHGYVAKVVAAPLVRPLPAARALPATAPLALPATAPQARARRWAGPDD